jgi:hypothetical protein
MNPRIKPIKLKIIAAIFIDTLLLITLLLVGYAFFIPARAEHADWPTDTAVPSSTCAHKPTATSTPEPSPTFTIEPSATSTIEPSATSTLEPSITSTLEPSTTSTLEPSPTSTLEPSATSTLEPTLTLVPTNPPNPTETPTVAPSPTSTQPHVHEPSPTYKTYIQTPKATSTPEVVTCPNCYLIKDFRELITSGFYAADLLNKQEISSILRVAITLYKGYKVSAVGETIEMVDTQPADEVMRVETPLWSIKPVPGATYWIHTIATAQTTEDTLWFVLDEWVQINLSDNMMKEP